MVRQRPLFLSRNNPMAKCAVTLLASPLRVLKCALMTMVRFFIAHLGRLWNITKTQKAPQTPKTQRDGWQQGMRASLNLIRGICASSTAPRMLEKWPMAACSHQSMLKINSSFIPTSLRLLCLAQAAKNAWPLSTLICRPWATGPNVTTSPIPAIRNWQGIHRYWAQSEDMLKRSTVRLRRMTCCQDAKFTASLSCTKNWMRMTAN